MTIAVITAVIALPISRITTIAWACAIRAAEVAFIAPCITVVGIWVSTIIATGTGRAGFHRARLVDYQAASAKWLTIHALDRSLCLALTAHFHKAETFRAACVSLHHDFGTHHMAKLCKRLLQIMITHPIG